MLKKGVARRDICNLFKALVLYNESGISILESLTYYEKQCEKEAVKRMVSQLVSSMKNGRRFSEALRQSPAFEGFIPEMIGVGEQSGQMSEILREILFYLEQEADLRREIKSNLYPVGFFLCGLVIAISLAVFLVIPKMGDILQNDLHAPLPAITQIVLGICNATADFWFVELALLVAGVFAYRYIKGHDPEKIDRLLLKIPFYGPLYYDVLQYRLNKVLALTLNAGIAMGGSVKSTALAVDHIPLKNALLEAVRQMSNGASPADAFRRVNKERLISENLLVLMKVGQEAGTLPQIFANVAEDNRKDVMAKGKNIGSKIGSAIIIPGMAAIIFVLAAVYAPLISMMGSATTMQM